MLKAVTAIFIFVSLLGAGGCQTASKTARGIGLVGEGMAEDAYIFYRTIEDADNWIRKHTW